MAVKVICGIYKITNLVNNKVYIGKSVNILERWQEHLRKVKFNAGAYLHKAMRHYGKDNFILEIVEEVSRDKLNSKEIFYIDKYDSYYESGRGYNLTHGGDGGAMSPDAIHRMSEKLKGSIPWNKGIPWEDSVKDKIREAHLGIPLSEAHKKKIGDLHRGRKRPPETGQRISAALKGKSRPSMRGKPSGMLGKKQSEESRQKMSESNKGKHSDPRGPMSEEQKQRIRDGWSDEAKQAAAERARKQEHSTGWHPSDETRQKMSEAKKGKPATNLGIPRTDGMKENDRIVKLKHYLKRGSPRIKCTHLEPMKEIETRYFVSANEASVQLVGYPRNRKARHGKY
jgi:group I intron endonuclease